MILSTTRKRIKKIDKISGGMTSNHNEAIHSILFQMVRKTEADGMDTMKLEAALYVIMMVLLM